MSDLCKVPLYKFTDNTQHCGSLIEATAASAKSKPIGIKRIGGKRKAIIEAKKLRYNAECAGLL